MRGGAEIIMKKLLSILFCLTILPAFADIRIKKDTQIKWNSYVVVAAAENTGLKTFLGNSSLVYNKILFNLLQRDMFSLEEAGNVCYDEFANYIMYTLGYDILSEEYDKYSREFWSKCNEDFVMELVNANNKIQFTINDPNQTKIYSNDKLYYAKETNTIYSIDDGIPCRYAVFESATDKIVATCDLVITNKAEDVFAFLFKSVVPDVEGYDDFSLNCGIRIGSSRYGVCDRLTYKPGEYKQLYGSVKNHD